MEKTNIDLDALAPQGVTVTIGGVIHEVVPPKVSDVMLLTKYSKLLKDFESLEDEEIVKIGGVIEDIARRCIPTLQDNHITLAHLLILPDILVGSTMGKEAGTDPKVPTLTENSNDS
jgi:hypothetical protein